MGLRSPYQPCVSCRGNMTPGNISGITFMRCEECAAVWINDQALHSILKSSKHAPELSELVVRDDGSTKRPCPICQNDMDIAWLRSLQLDWCADHGVWLDPEELQRALAGEGTRGMPREDPAAALVNAILRDLGD
jgi:Zn-finger nucleic acid-binding protein